jgi:hypothetical protein
VLPEPDPLDPRPLAAAHAMRADQLRDTRDVAERAPAGAAPRGGEFGVGDTFAGMGLMDALDADFRQRPRQFSRADDARHGVPTPPNPFPNPLYGPGRYSQLGLTDEEFARLRDRAHVVPVMVTALALSEADAGAIFDAVAAREGRQLISVAEFHEQFKRVAYR